MLTRLRPGRSRLRSGRAIARAIAKDPEIYIFDDSFSALDYKTDVKLRSELQKETNGSTTLIVAQRISTILHAAGIVDYLAGDLANPTAAASFKKSLMECLDTLRMFPQSGSLVQNGYVPQTGIREKLVGNYLLFYQTDAETRTVYILRVVHGSRDLDRVVKNLT